jgi:maltooligosyltrehalose trehalohydrolase
MKPKRTTPWKAVVRRLPIGAEIVPGGAHFRVWAVRPQAISVVLLDRSDENPIGESALEAEGNGYFSAFVPDVKAGDLYAFRLDGQSTIYPDPASRFQPRGPFGPSEVVDPDGFVWNDGAWQGIPETGRVIYEMHVGTFTREGNFAAASQQLDELAELGITVVEMMPVADFAGAFGWGYDGVNLFAPSRLYVSPSDFRHFVDRAHRLGIGVILDVVYNHLGPAGQHLGCYSDQYFTDRYKTDWGAAIRFDGPGAAPVREYFIANAGYWIAEFHLDGLRLDATQNIYDTSEDHILAAITRQVRAVAASRATLLVAENEPQNTQLVRPQEWGGYGLDAIWNDDFHHAAMVLLSGHHEAYYSDYRGTPQEFISAVKYGYLYQGQWHGWQKKRRGRPALDLPPTAFVCYLQNHDQIANSARGLRCHALASPGRYRAMTTLLLLIPSTPMLFQGQEFASSRPFYYFAAHAGEQARLVREGRATFLSQFPSFQSPELQASLPDPADRNTFEQCKLDFSERKAHEETYRLHCDLLRLRRMDPVFQSQRPAKVDGAVLGPEAFVLRFFGEGGDDRLLLVNFGADLHLAPAPEPLLAPPAEKSWKVLWSSESIVYGGSGTPPMDAEGAWTIVGQAAIVMAPEAVR